MRFLPLLILALALSAPSAASARPWAQVKSWAVQLESADPAALAATPFDLLMIDYSGDGTYGARLTADQVQALQRKPDGSRRLVVAYVNVGVAARHRFYWQPQFAPDDPPWVGPALPDWDGLYRVRYWDEDWTSLMLSWVDQITEAGFDGLLVDPADTHLYFEENGWGSARADLVTLIRSMAEHARQGAGGVDFGVFAQNAEDLVNDPLFLRIATGVVGQATYFGAQGFGTPTPPTDTEGMEALLRVARQGGLLALNVDFTENPEQIKTAHARASLSDILEYAAPADPARLQVVPGVQP